MNTSTTGGAEPPSTCDSYCADITENCIHDLAQFLNTESCKATCADYRAGKPGDITGNSLACRDYHARAAAFEPQVHCPHAGPTGGDNDVSDTMENVCGDGCEAFCDIAVKTCNAQYHDAVACMSACRKFKPNAFIYSAAFYSMSENWKDDFGCRMYHLSVATTSPDAAKTHCPHITLASPVCTK